MTDSSPRTETPRPNIKRTDAPCPGTLRLDLGTSPLRSEHERLLRTALRRGDKDPEGALSSSAIEGDYSALALELAAQGWRDRALHEHHSAAVFSRLLPQLMAAEAPIEYKTSVLRMSMDELRHAALCFGVARFLGGTPCLEADLRTHPIPQHEDTTPRVAALRNVMFVGCLSETISVSLLTEERELCREPTIRRVVDQLAADEVLHARLGWSYLGELWPQLTPEERGDVDAYLPRAFGYLEAKMLHAMPTRGKLSPGLRRELEGLGATEGSAGRELFYATLEGVIAPRLRDYGLDALRAWEGRIPPA